MTALQATELIPVDGVEFSVVRSTAYALFADLMTSPESDAARALPPADLSDALTALSKALPFNVSLSNLTAAASDLNDSDAHVLQAAYATLFEAGQGAGSVREEVARNLAAGAKEEVVRFYQHFGYGLNSENQWQADHLAFELEFLHFLCVLEANGADASVAFGQRDFLARHPADWWPIVMRSLMQTDLHPWHRALFTTLNDFLRADLQWQNARLEGVA